MHYVEKNVVWDKMLKGKEKVHLLPLKHNFGLIGAIYDRGINVHCFVNVNVSAKLLQLEYASFIACLIKLLLATTKSGLLVKKVTLPPLGNKRL